MGKVKDGMEVKTITKDNFEEEVLACKKPVFLIFFSEKNEEAQNQLNIIENLPKELEEKMVAGKVDVDVSVMLALQYQIMDIPTIIVMNYGIFQQRVKGIQQEEDIIKILEGCR